MPNQEMGAAAAKVLIENLVGKGKRTDLERRERCFDAIAAVARLLVFDASDPQFSAPKIGLCWDAARTKAQQAIDDMAARGQALRSGGVSVCGLHFIDPSVGRRSRIWVTKDWTTPATSRVPADKHFWTWWAYSDLWLRSYWHVLRTSTTLVNAFHERILAWNATPVHIRWHAQSKLNTPGDLRADEALVSATQPLAKEFSAAIAVAVAAEWDEIEGIASVWSNPKADEATNREADERYAASIDAMLGRVVQRLREKCVLARLDEAAIDCRRRILEDPEIRKAFVAMLRKLEGTERAHSRDDVASALEREWQSKDPARRHTRTWEDVLSCVKAIQSAVMNQHSFCSDAGFWLHRFQGCAQAGDRAPELYLILGYSRRPTDVIEPELQGLRNDIGHLLAAAEELGQIREKPQATPDATETNIVSMVDKRINPALPHEGLLRWSRIVLELARKSVHERRDLNFLVGFGPSYLAQVRGRVYEPAPAHLVSPNASADLIVHFIKSYFSIFGNNDRRLIWFDTGGRFRGVFESPLPVQDDSWLGQWGSLRDGEKEQYLIARIFGLDTFDLTDRELQPIVRFVKGKITPPTGVEEIADAIEKVSQRVFPDQTLARATSCFAQAFTDHLKRRGHGTSFILRNSQRRHVKKRGGVAEEWRSKLTEQCRSLAPDLVQYRAPIVDMDGFLALAGANAKRKKAVMDRLVDILAPLADLDGALLLTVGIGSAGLYASPAQQVVPLIVRRNGTVPLDFFGRLREEMRANLQKKGAAVSSVPTLPRSRDAERLSYPQLLALVEAIQASPRPGTQTGTSPEWVDDLAFLNSAGTRHHSLWGISVTASDSLFAVTLSEDGHVRVFWDGSEFVGRTPKSV